MTHNHYVKDRRTSQDFWFTTQQSLMLDFRYEVFLLQQAANELNKHNLTDEERADCKLYLPQQLIITPRFPLKALPALKRNQMEIMLQNHYVKNKVDLPDLKSMSETILLSCIHQAVMEKLPNPHTTHSDVTHDQIGNKNSSLIDSKAVTNSKPVRARIIINFLPIPI